MRIIAGRFAGTRLAAPGKDRAPQLRPTSDRCREAVFNLLAGGRYDDPFSGARVLDLFAGTGALGLEALSRGAGFVTFVESEREALHCLRTNISKCRASEQARVIRSDARLLKRRAVGAAAAGDASEAHGLILLDPPYASDLGSAALGAAFAAGWMAADALIVWEHRAPIPALLSHMSVLESRRYGNTRFTLLRVQGHGLRTEGGR